jgi:hypothetical protein
MTPHLAHICRHPIKGHGRETLASVVLTPGACLPWDRHWAVAHDAARLTEGWNPCVNFARGAKAPALMAIRSRLEEETATVTLSHPMCEDLRFKPDAADDLPRFLDWVRPLTPTERAQPDRIVCAGRGMTDSAFASVAVLSCASLRDLSERMGQPLDIHRWRGNLWLDGSGPWAEETWVGRRIRIGEAVLRIEERITRCKATMANPDSGQIDADTLGALDRAFGHQDFGLYATVIDGGNVALNDGWDLL